VELGSKHWTGRTEQEELDRKNRTGRTGTGRTGQVERDGKNRTEAVLRKPLKVLMKVLVQMNQVFW
jgi:hypothetical protein